MTSTHERIRRRRKEMGMSMQQLAEAVGVRSWQTVQQWQTKEEAKEKEKDKWE